MALELSFVVAVDGLTSVRLTSQTSATESLLGHLAENLGAQVWVATHSLALLATFDAKDIWYVTPEGVKRVGRAPEQVLIGLLGNEEERVQLALLLRQPAELAAIRFAYECLQPARVIAEAQPEDPQIRQTMEFVRRHLHSLPVVRVLDYGAGEGRLLQGYLEAFREYDHFSMKWEYFAFEQDASSAAKLRTVVENAFPDATGRVAVDRSQLGQFPSHSFHAVVMCNVLHEVHPSSG